MNTKIIDQKIEELLKIGENVGEAEVLKMLEELKENHKISAKDFLEAFSAYKKNMETEFEKELTEYLKRSSLNPQEEEKNMKILGDFKSYLKAQESASN
jgi:hypothetical protein